MWVVLVDWGSVSMARGDSLAYGPCATADEAWEWAAVFAEAWDWRVRPSVVRLGAVR